MCAESHVLSTAHGKKKALHSLKYAPGTDNRVIFYASRERDIKTLLNYLCRPRILHKFVKLRLQFYYCTTASVYVDLSRPACQIK